MRLKAINTIKSQQTDLLLSLLNALLLLDDAERIESIGYLPVELVPDTAFSKEELYSYERFGTK